MLANGATVPFSSGKFKSTPIPELRSQAETDKQLRVLTPEEFTKEYKDNNLDFKTPFMVKGGGPAMLKTFNEIQERAVIENMRDDPYFKEKVRIDYYSPLEAQKIREGREDAKNPILPRKYDLKRFFTTCFVGNRGKPMVASNASQDCEFGFSAKHLYPREWTKKLRFTWPGTDDVLVDNLQAKWHSFITKNFFKQERMPEIEQEIGMLLRKKALHFMMEQIDIEYQHLNMGPAGSGGRIETGYGSSIMDMLVHGSRRWVFISEDEVNLAAGDGGSDLSFMFDSAWGFFTRGADEFQGTFNNWLEVNQEAGDVVFVPLGWAKASLNLEDSASYVEKFVHNQQGIDEIVGRQIWGPDFEGYDTWNLGFCHAVDDYPDNLPSLGSVERNQWYTGEMNQAQPHETYKPALTVMLTCAKIHHTRDEIKKFMNYDYTLCQNRRYEKCRDRLVEKIAAQPEVAGKVFVNWTPEELPMSEKERRIYEAQKKRDEDLDADEYAFTEDELSELDDL